MADNETRPIPTVPGWWWRQGNHGPYVEEVAGDINHAPYISISGSSVEDDGTWICPVPSAAVCGALAGYADALVAWLYGTSADSGTAERWYDARQVLQETLLEEREVDHE